MSRDRPMQAESQKINILMVDDSPTNLLALEAILQAPDRNLVRAASGDEALRYLLEGDVAVILRSKVAVFVELFKKTEEIKRQAELLHEKNIELENANLQRLGKLIDLGQELAAERDPEQVLEKFCGAAREIVGAEHAGVGVLAENGGTLRYYCHCDVCERGDDMNAPQASE